LKEAGNYSYAFSVSIYVSAIDEVPRARNYTSSYLVSLPNGSQGSFARAHFGSAVNLEELSLKRAQRIPIFCLQLNGVLGNDEGEDRN